MTAALCFACDGRGERCWTCGEIEGCCECDDCNIGECDECDGTGLCADADAEGGTNG